jgi:hemerythrin-like metal-binding protein
MTPATATSPAASPSLAWSEDLVLGMDAIDRTHEEFVALLARAEMAADETLLECLHELTEHTIEHFGREDQWMQATQFAPQHCHAMQHRVVLQTLDELMRRGSEDGDLQLVREILPELGKWFHQHAQTMDAGLAAHLDQVGFDPATGHLSRPTGRPHEDLAFGTAAGPCAG